MIAMNIAHPSSWAVVAVEKSGHENGLRSISDGDLTTEAFSVIEFADINLIQFHEQSTEKREAALITVECEGPVKYFTLRQIDIVSNARFVEVFAGDEYVVTVKGEISTTNDCGTNGYQFSHQLRQQIMTNQLRLKFLSIKNRPNPSTVMEVPKLDSAAIALHLIKLSLSVIRHGCRGGQPDESIAASRPLAIPPHMFDAKEVYPSSGNVLSSAVVLEMMMQQQCQGPQKEAGSSIPAFAGVSSGPPSTNSQQPTSNSLGISELMMMKSVLLSNIEQLLDKKLAPLHERLDRMQTRLDEHLSIVAGTERGIKAEIDENENARMKAEIHDSSGLDVEQEDRKYSIEQITNINVEDASSSSNNINVGPETLTVSHNDADDLNTEFVFVQSLLPTIEDNLGSRTCNIAIDNVQTVNAADADSALKGDMKDLMMLLRKSNSLF